MGSDQQQMMDIRKMVSRGWVVSRRGRGLVMALLISLLGLWHTGQAADFSCTAGDGACLIDAINQANTNGEANTITLEAGTYTLTEVNNDTDGPNGLPSVTGVVTIQGAGADATILERAADAPRFRLVHVAASGNLTLHGMTLRNGNTLTGGGLLNDGGTVRLVQTLFIENFAGVGGGVSSSGGTVSITQARFTDNGAQFLGGGLRVTSGLVSIVQTTFASNISQGGGGIEIREIGGSPSAAVVTIVDSTVVDNMAGGPGGGILNSGLLLVTNSTMAHNTTRGPFRGGGIFTSGTLIILNATIADNGAGPFLAGGIDAESGTVTLQNTILARNSGAFSSRDCIGAITSLGNNLIGDPTGCTITLQDTDLTGDPGLDTFIDDGTPGNGHFPLLPGSPATDAGNDAVCPRFDQLGEPRVGQCDIGAIEFQGKHRKRH